MTVPSPASTAPTADDTARGAALPATRSGLYTPDERRRRDASPWTLVQGILAPLQFLVMAVSVFLVVRYLRTGDGLDSAHVSVIVKTLVLYTIMVTGAIWEKEVFGQYLFAPAFFWEDVVSFGVIALHTAYLVGLAQQWNPRYLMVLALVAYGTYAVNAIQFILKLRAARLQEARDLARLASPSMASAAEAA
jgi:3-vinyl bacteriochlorophyllide hydratase